MKTLQKTLVLALVLASGLGCENRARAEYPVLHNGQVVSEYQVAKPNKAPDEFEPNSKRDMALQIFTNQTQLHTINPDGDEDWIMFVPDQSGRYVLELTDATIDLEGELWAQSGKDREKRLEKFKLPRGRTAALQVDVTPNVGYFKVRVEAEDNDDIGAYRISARQLTASGPEQPNVRRPDVFESDNDPEIAIGIEDDVTQLHTIYPRDDEDWMVYAPQQPGEYLLKISNVTADLKGELWVQRGDDKERRVDKFDVSRWGRTISLRADGAVRYFKIRLEADDNDDTGDYSVAVVRKAPTVIRTTMHTPPIYTPTEVIVDARPVYTRSTTLVYRTLPCRRYYPRPVIRTGPRILGSVRYSSGNWSFGIGIGLGTSRHHKTPHLTHRRPITTSHHRPHTTPRVTTHHRRPVTTSHHTPHTTSRTTTPRVSHTTGRSSSRITIPSRSHTTVRPSVRTTVPSRSHTTVRPSSRTITPSLSRTTVRPSSRIITPSPSRTTVRPSSRTTTPSPIRTTLRPPTRITAPSRSRTMVGSSSRTITPSPSRTTVRPSSRTTTPSPIRTTLRPPTRITAPSRSRTTVRTPSRTITPTRTTLRPPTRTTPPSRSRTTVRPAPSKPVKSSSSRSVTKPASKTPSRSSGTASSRIGFRGRRKK